MYAKAAEIGLSATFVDLRHEATHGEMPSLTVLRDAAQKALAWLRKDYWDNITTKEGLKESLREDVNSDMMIDGEAEEVEPWEPIKVAWKAPAIGTA